MLHAYQFQTHIHSYTLITIIAKKWLDYLKMGGEGAIRNNSRKEKVVMFDSTSLSVSVPASNPIEYEICSRKVNEEIVIVAFIDSTHYSITSYIELSTLGEMVLEKFE